MSEDVKVTIRFREDDIQFRMYPKGKTLDELAKALRMTADIIEAKNEYFVTSDESINLFEFDPELYSEQGTWNHRRIVFSSGRVTPVGRTTYHCADYLLKDTRKIEDIMNKGRGY